METGAQEGWLEHVFDKLDVGVFSIDHATGRILRANEAYARILGFESAAAAVGHTALDHYADPKERLEIQTRLLATESFRKTGVARIEVRRLRHDTREPVDVLIAVFATFDADGRVVRMDCTIEDIGDRKRAEKSFRASEERFRTLFEKSGVGMAFADLEGHIYRVNAALCRLLGRTETELLGMEALALVHPDDRPERPVPGAAEIDATSGRELRLLRGDGEVVWGYVSWSWLSDGDGAPHSSVAIIHDVSERKRLERSLLRMAKLESLGVLAGGIAHDFNNILAVILGNLSLAARLPDAGPQTREVLAEAEDASKRARELAQQLVTFAKGGEPVKRAGSIGDVVREAAGFYLRGSNVAAELVLPRDLWPAEFDPVQIGQVLQNLLINARQAMPGGGSVVIEAENVAFGPPGGVPLPPGRYVRVTVEDHGVGIAKDNLDRIFDPYFSTKPTGTGLGLATAHSIVLRHGGHLAVESQLGEGSKFSVYLPASAAPVVVPPRAGAEPGPDLSARVLLMDDEPGVRRISSKILGAAGVEVELATNGEEAIAAYSAALAAGRPFVLVILDLTVPGGLGGVETLERLRAIDPAVKAIVATGYSDDPVAANCREHGFSAALPKPFTAAELEGVVRVVLGGAALDG